MIVEDDAFMLSYLTDVFDKGGYETLPVYGHHEAISKAKEFNPDVIVLDIHLDNGYTGYELSEELREEEITRHTPTVFITAEGTDDNRCKAFMCGALDFVLKPFDTQELLNRVAPLASIGRLTKLLTNIGSK
jgi:DNA-binding response OmpR family regulator